MRELIHKVALESVKDYCTLVIPVRGGKSKLGLEIAKNYNKVLVSYPNSTIYESWVDSSNKFNLSIDNITFTTHLSLDKHDLKEFDIVIVDELHALSENNINYFILNSPKKAIGLTGTPANFGVKKEFMDKYLPISYEIGIDKTTNVTNKDYQITVHLLNPSKERNIKLSSGKFWSEEAKVQFWENKYKSTKNFMDMLKLIQAIQNSPTKLNYIKQLSNKIDRGLIFLETIEQCDSLNFPSYHSKNKNSEQNLEDFQNEKINILTSIGQLKAGITFKNVNKAIILHCYSSNNKAIQKIGRTLNLIEGEQQKAFIDIICLNNTRDVNWVKKGLEDLEQNKIIWKIIKY